MAEKQKINLNVRSDLYRWVRQFELDRSVSKTRLGIAGLAAMRSLTPPERDEMLKWAALLDEGLIRWQDFEKMADKSTKERLAALARLIKKALDSPPEEP